MEREAQFERNSTAGDLAVLKSYIDGILKPDAEDPRVKSGDVGLVSAEMKDGIYEVSFNGGRTLELRFDAELNVKDASIEWEEGDPAYYDGEFTPIRQWREKKWLKDLHRQHAEEQKVLRFGDENYAEFTETIYPEEIKGFVGKILRAVEAELTNPEAGQPLEASHLSESTDDWKIARNGWRHLTEGGYGSINGVSEEELVDE
jgi:hypothetical protein